MGKVRSQIKLTNAIDEELANRGLLLPNNIRVREVEGLVDSGATCLVIPLVLAQELGLRIVNQRIAEYANGSKEMVGVTGPITIECYGRQTSDEALVVGDEVLIGQVILEKLDLLVDCKNQQLIPNPKYPDYPVAIIK
jgi:clan AA aspartic protease